MKKVISLALAMAMALSMTSMAITFSPVDDSVGAPDGADMYPGETYVFDVPGWTFANADVDDSDYRLTVDWDEGSALVKSVKLLDRRSNGGPQDVMRIEIELKENYTIEDPKDLVGTLTLKEKWDGGAEHELVLEATVCNDVEDIDGGDNRDDATAIDVDDNTIYNVTTSGWFDFGGDGNRLSSVLVRMSEDEQIFAYWNEDKVDEIEDKYYDLDADLEYVTFVAKPDLDRPAQVAIQGDYSDEYNLYEIKNGDINEMEYNFDPDDGLFTFETDKLGSYVISDKELVAEADEPADDTADEPADDTTTQNPDTGANDVVGVAVALAAVSLVAAGAVSLKK